MCELSKLTEVEGFIPSDFITALVNKQDIFKKSEWAKILPWMYACANFLYVRELTFLQPHLALEGRESCPEEF